MTTHCTVMSTGQNSKASDGFLSEQVPVPSGPHAERVQREQGRHVETQGAVSPGDCSPLERALQW